MACKYFPNGPQHLAESVGSVGGVRDQGAQRVRSRLAWGIKEKECMGGKEKVRKRKEEEEDREGLAMQG